MTFLKRFRYISIETWVVETVSIFTSVSCLVAIVVILSTNDGYPLSNFEAPLSISATVSVLITASKSSLLLVVASCISQRKWEYFGKPRPLLDFDTFDGASRGPLGALQLLFGRARHAKIAALGALITTIVLAWEPSAQLLIELGTRPVIAQELEASLYSSFVYNSGAKFASDGYSINGQDNGMIRATMNGLYGVTPEPPFTCVAAKCIWPDYTTLGFESKCDNVTTTSQRICDRNLEGTLRNMTALDETQSCNITTPRGVVLKNEFSPFYYQTAVSVSSLCHGSVPNPEYYDMLRCYPYTNSSTVATFAVYRSTEKLASNVGVQRATPWEVIECEVRLVAMRHFEISVQNGSFHIGHTITTPLLPQYVTLYPEEWGIDTNDGNLNFSESGRSREYDVGTFEINKADWFYLVNLLYTKIFRGNVTVGSYLWERENMSPWLQVFLEEDITALAANLATSLTNYLPKTRNSTLEHGNAYRDEIFVTVRWGWSVIHIFTVFAALALLIITWVTHMSAGRPAWKDGSVALLLHQISGMDAESWRAIDECEEVEEYEKAVNDYVESVWVQASTSGTLCLEKVDPQAGEERIPLIIQVESTAPKVSK